MSELLVTCDLCGSPLADEVMRCPVCNEYRGTGNPSPFTKRFWAASVGVVGLALLIALIGALIARGA